MIRFGGLRAVPRTVVVLGIASFLTDLSSEMIYPLLPALLAQLGASAVALGVIEGAADSLSSVLKVVSGKVADRLPRRKPLVVVGYAVSGAARPLIALATAWTNILGFRLLDRVGKGLRTSPRDALIADVTPDHQRGRAYGLHRAFDNAGAFVGPLVAAALLGVGVSLRGVIGWAAVPAALTLLVLVAFVREAPRALPPRVAHARSGSGGYPAGFFLLLGTLALFTLGAGTDAFLLLRLSEAGVSQSNIVLVWAAHNLVRSVAVYIGGPLSDRYDRRVLLRLGWFMHAVSLALLALPLGHSGLVAIVVLYALYRGFTEPTERALVAAYAPASRRGSAFGWYHGVVGLVALPSGLAIGLLWQARGHGVALCAAAATAALAIVVNTVLLRHSPAR
jgi:MFS family permease